jgi:phage anti-repressor protein
VLFYSFLNYDEYTDYVVDLDDVWKWLGFSQKANTKRVLEKNFIKNKDYKILLCKNEEHKKSHGGTNKETILLNINTFKLFCLLAGTEKAKDIHKYYVRLVNILFY